MQYGKYVIECDVHPWTPYQLSWVTLQRADDIRKKGAISAPSTVIDCEVPVPTLVCDFILTILILEDWQVYLHMAPGFPMGPWVILSKELKAYKWMCGLSITIAFLDSKPHTSHCKNCHLAMALSNNFCKQDSTMDLYTDEQGNKLTKGDIIFCKKQPFVVTEEGYIDYYSSGAMETYSKPQIPSSWHFRKR